MLPFFGISNFNSLKFTVNLDWIAYCMCCRGESYRGDRRVLCVLWVGEEVFAARRR